MMEVLLTVLQGFLGLVLVLRLVMAEKEKTLFHRFISFSFAVVGHIAFVTAVFQIGFDEVYKPLSMIMLLFVIYSLLLLNHWRIPDLCGHIGRFIHKVLHGTTY